VRLGRTPRKISGLESFLGSTYGLRIATVARTVRKTTPASYPFDGTSLGPVADSAIIWSFRNSSSERPASRIIPAIVIALTGLFRGITTLRVPSVMMMCFPCRNTRKPAFCRARTASRWLTPGSLGIAKP